MYSTTVISTGRYFGPLQPSCAWRCTASDVSRRSGDLAAAHLRALGLAYLFDESEDNEERAHRRRLLSVLSKSREENATSLDLRTFSESSLEKWPVQLARHLPAQEVLLSELDVLPAWLARLPKLRRVSVASCTAECFDASALEALQRSCTLHLGFLRSRTVRVPHQVQLELEPVRKKCRVLRSSSGHENLLEIHHSKLAYLHPSRMEENYNCEVSMLGTGERIVCRHLALRWAQLDAKLAPGDIHPFYRLSHPGQLLALVPASTDEEYDRLMNSRRRIVLDDHNFFRFCAAVFQTLQATGEVRRFLLLTPVHAMALALSIEDGEQDAGPVRLLRLFDPNTTRTALHWELPEPAGIQAAGAALSLARMLSPATLDLYFGGDKPYVHLVSLEKPGRWAPPGFDLPAHVCLSVARSCRSPVAWQSAILADDEPAIAFLGEALLRRLAKHQLAAEETLALLAPVLRAQPAEPDGCEDVALVEYLPQSRAGSMRTWCHLLLKMANLGTPHSDASREQLWQALRPLAHRVSRFYASRDEAVVTVWLDMLKALADLHAIEIKKLIALMTAKPGYAGAREKSFGGTSWRQLPRSARARIKAILTHPLVDGRALSGEWALVRLRQKALCNLPRDEGRAGH